MCKSFISSYKYIPKPGCNEGNGGNRNDGSDDSDGSDEEAWAGCAGRTLAHNLLKQLVGGERGQNREVLPPLAAHYIY